MEIDIKDYLREDEIKELAKEALIYSVKDHFADEKAIERIITNTAYGIVWKMVDECFNKSLEEVLTDKIKNIIDNFSEYNVFCKPSAWGREANSAYKHLQKSVESQFSKIDKIVSENVESQTLLYLKEEMAEAVQESILSLFKEA